MVNWCCRYYNYQDTGFYYLQTRYYDPAICRFINADTFATTDIEGLLSTNMFSYCENNPVNNSDPSGELLNTIVGALAGGLVGGISSAIRGEGFWSGAAQGAVSGAIAGAGVDIALACVATGGIGVAAAGLITFGFGFGGSLVGEQTRSLINCGKLAKIDKQMLTRAAISGGINMLAAGFSGLLKYADEGAAGFNTSKALKDILKKAFEKPLEMSAVDVTSAFGSVHFAIQGAICIDTV